MNYKEFEDVLVAIAVFSMFMAAPLLLLVGMPCRPPYWYRYVRVNCRMYIRAWHRSPL